MGQRKKGTVEMAKMAKRGMPRKAETDLLNTMAELIDERDDARKLAEDRLIESKALAKQVSYLDERCKELLAEIRMYEQETATLKQIIIDALRQKD